MRGGLVSDTLCAFEKMKILSPVACLCVFVSMPLMASEKMLWQNEYLSDPTRPMHYSAGGRIQPDSTWDQFALSSIVVGPERRQAVINGKLLSLGDQVNDALVLEIQPDAVILTRGNERHTLKWRTPVVIKKK